MANSVDQVTVEFLQAFADALNRHDVNALMEFMTHDCVYEASSGLDVYGTRYEGQKAVREGFASVWESFPDAQWLGARHFAVGSRGVSEWTFTGTNKDGTHAAIHPVLFAVYLKGWGMYPTSSTTWLKFWHLTPHH